MNKGRFVDYIPTEGWADFVIDKKTGAPRFIIFSNYEQWVHSHDTSITLIAYRDGKTSRWVIYQDDPVNGPSSTVKRLACAAAGIPLHD